MKTFRPRKIYETYEDVTICAETLEQAYIVAREKWNNQCQADGPYLVKEQYKSIESTGDIDLDSEELIEQNWQVTYDIYKT